MDCSMARELLSEYIDGMLDSDISEEIKEHIESCADCRQEYMLLKSIVDSCHELDEINLPDDFNLRLHERLILEKDSIRRENRLGWVQKYKRIAAVFLVLAVSLGALINSGIFRTNKKTAATPQKAYTAQGIENRSGSLAQNESNSGARQPGIKSAGIEGAQDSAYNESTSAKAASTSVYYNVVINLNGEEYQKLFADIAVEIEGMQGYLKQKEPPVYMLPQGSLDAFLSRMKDNYKINDIYTNTVNAAEQSSTLQSEITELEKKQAGAGSGQYSGPTNADDINTQITNKKDELKDLNSRLGYAVIQINRN